jgi:uncharacterized protein YaeQ
MVGIAIAVRKFSFFTITHSFMALKSTIYKADLQISDMDRHYYQNHQLTIAKHPSETDERMMMRVLAFALHASESLAFGKGLSDVEEPDVWQKDLTGAIDLWIEVGLPDDKRILKACGRAERVIVYSYGTTADIWWKQMGSRVERAKSLSVIQIPPNVTAELEKLAQRTMQLQCTIDDGQIWIGSDDMTVQVTQEIYKAPAAG